jgi:O-antigen/teichoic acid export membrane protein
MHGIALRAVLTNSGWLMLDKLVRLLLTLFVTAWIARYLGPESFGDLAYVLAYIAFFQAIVLLGADGIAVRDIARNAVEAPRILGSLLVMRVCVGIACWLLGIVIMMVFGEGGSRTVILFALAGGALAFQAGDTVDLWFQSQTQSKRTAVVRIAAQLCSAGVRILLILTHAPIEAFAAVVALEGMLIATGLALAYRWLPTPGRWTASVGQARALLQECWPFLMSSISVIVYLRIDQLMIRNMLGAEQLGTYAAAITLSQMGHVVPATLVVSLAPYIARKKAEGEAEYLQALLLVFRAFGTMALLFSITTAVLAPTLVDLFFGEQYSDAATILTIHVFTNLFVFQGTAQSLWYTNNRTGRLILRHTLMGGCAAVIANWILLPRYGISGAAVAALISFGIGGMFGNLISARPIFLMQLGIKATE